jgi:hypothetical protein
VRGHIVTGEIFTSIECKPYVLQPRIRKSNIILNHQVILWIKIRSESEKGERILTGEAKEQVLEYLRS